MFYLLKTNNIYFVFLYYGIVIRLKLYLKNKFKKIINFLFIIILNN